MRPRARWIKALGLGAIGCLAILLIISRAHPPPPSGFVDSPEDNEPLAVDPRTVQRAAIGENLDPFAIKRAGSPKLAQSRTGLLVERARLRRDGDQQNVARLNSVLAREAFVRAGQVTSHWLDQRDPVTGLLPHSLRHSGQYWSYGDVGADLFPFLAITTRELLPSRYGEILDTLTAERLLRDGLPWDIVLDTQQPRQRDRDRQVLADVEYVKDGLLTLVERLGPEPWLPRMREVLDALLDQPDVATPRGPIVSSDAEVNGSLLQVLARLHWAHSTPRDLEMARRIAAVYLDDVVPTTGWIPPEKWDFMSGRALGASSLHLGDHGNEIISGLIEWHIVEVARGLPEQAAHGESINRMLDRLLEAGRTPLGLWIDGVNYPSGRVVDRTLNDNWGYLGQAYLNQAATLRRLNEHATEADRYEQETRVTLRAVTDVVFYQWEHGDMDGYADSLESALYLLHYLDLSEAGDWVDRHMGVLYGFQRPDGSVTDENIDGNFIRTTMLYGLWLTQGTRLEPWSSTLSIGATAHDDCLYVHMQGEDIWSGRLLFDTPRHAQYLGLPRDYPRLNQWPEWWTAAPGRTYNAAWSDGTIQQLTNDELAAGLPITLMPARATTLDVCPT